LYLLASLSCVDAVVAFSEDTPLELIRQVTPDILVKGGDYAPDSIVGAKEVTAHGGRVEVIPFVEGFSTSRLESKILELHRHKNKET
jgi:D-beta-D-heptose 7-phosphate kinase/D-beta-D-heptose 1-phosphate adenosyltransferase